jgi:hypothetical protein
LVVLIDSIGYLAAIQQLFDEMGIAMTKNTHEYLRRRDQTRRKGAEYKKRFDVKAKKCKDRNRKIREGCQKALTDAKKGYLYSPGMAGPYSTISCEHCGIMGHSRTTSKYCAKNQIYKGKFETWCHEVKGRVKVDEFDEEAKCKSCGRKGHKDSGSYRCMDHVAFAAAEEDAWDLAMFCWGEDEEVYRGKTTTCRLFRVLARVRVLLCRLARFSHCVIVYSYAPFGMWNSAIVDLDDDEIRESNDSTEIPLEEAAAELDRFDSMPFLDE